MERAIRFLLTVLLVASLCMTTAPPVFAETSISSYLNVAGKDLKLDTPIIQEKNITYLPVAETFRKMGGSVSWEPIGQLAHIYLSGDKIILKAGTVEGSLNGKSILLSTPSVLIEGRLYLPLDFFAEKLNMFIRQEKSANRIIVYLGNTKDIKYTAGEVYKVTAENRLGEHQYFVGNMLHINDLYFKDNELYIDTLSVNSGNSPESQKVKGYKDYSIFDSLKWDGSRYVLNMERVEQDYVYQKYGNKSSLRNLATKNGLYALYEYKNDMRQYYFDADGKFIGYGEDPDKGLILERDTTRLLSLKISGADEAQERYVIAGEDMAFLITKGYQVVTVSKEMTLKEKVTAPLLLKDGKNSFIVVGVLKAQGSNSNKIYCDFINMEEGPQNQGYWSITEVSGVSSIELEKAVLLNGKVIVLAKSGITSYIGVVDKANKTTDIQPLPAWLKGPELISGQGEYYLKWQDEDTIYLTKISV